MSNPINNHSGSTFTYRTGDTPLTGKVKKNAATTDLTAAEANALAQLNNFIKSPTNKPVLTPPEVDAYKIKIAEIAKGLEDIRKARSTPTLKDNASANPYVKSEQLAEKENNALFTEALDELLSDPMTVELIDGETDPIWFHDALNDPKNPQYGAVQNFLAKLDKVINQLVSYGVYTQLVAEGELPLQDEESAPVAAKNKFTSSASTTLYDNYFSALRDLLRLLVRMKALNREASTELRNLQAKTQLDAAKEAKQIMLDAADSALAMGIAGAAITGGVTIASTAFSAVSAFKQASAAKAGNTIETNKIEVKNLRYQINQKETQITHYEDSVKKIDDKIAVNQKQLTEVNDQIKNAPAATDTAALKEQQTQLQAEKDALIKEKGEFTKEKLQQEKEALTNRYNELEQQNQALSLQQLKDSRTANITRLGADILTGIREAASKVIDGISQSEQLKARAEAEYLNALVTAFGLSVNSADEVHKSGGDELRQVLDLLAQIDNRDTDAKANIANRIAH